MSEKTIKKEIKNHDLKPMDYSEAMKIQKGIKADTVTVERADGKQIVIATKTLASHLERGFKLVGKNAKAAPVPAAGAGIANAPAGDTANTPAAAAAAAAASPAPAKKAVAKKAAKKSAPKPSGV